MYVLGLFQRKCVKYYGMGSYPICLNHWKIVTFAFLQVVETSQVIQKGYESTKHKSDATSNIPINS